MKFTRAATTALLTLLSSNSFYAFAFAPRVAAASTTTSRKSRSALLFPSAILASCVRGGAGATSSSTTKRSATTTTTTTTTATDEATCTSSSYEELVEILQGLTHLSRAAAVLDYDQMVFMPQTDAASTERGKQQAALAAVIHEKSIDAKIGALLAELEEQESNALDNTQQRNVALARKAYDKKTKIPTALASKKASLGSQAYNTWAKARAADDFGMFQSVLGECIAVAKEIAQVTQTPEEQASNKPLYATMLDEFEVGMDPQRIDEMFQEIQEALVPLIDKVLGPEATPPNTDPLHGNFDIAAQEALSKDMVRAIGFDDTNGRIDVSVHPFTNSLGGPTDVRITSRFRTDEWYQGLAGSMHEAGHAMYEQNVGVGGTDTNTGGGLPVDNALSMGMHESQSLFWERHVGLSKEFWQYATPIVNDKLGLSNSPEELYAAVNAASRSLIRVEADELTYPLHVILRYNIERDFVEGRMDVKDIPTRWNEGMKSLLDVNVPSDAKGCLQDVHWSMLAYGYFPTYLIGAATAAQLAHYCKKDIADFDDKVASGDFKDIKAWMTEKVHKHGSRYTSLDEHLEAELGEKLNPKYFIDYLAEKYTELYKVK